MAKTRRKVVSILAMLCAVSVTASRGRADDPSSLAATAFESAQTVIMHGSTDVLSIAVPQQGEHIFAALYDGFVVMLDRTTRRPVRIVKCHDGPVSDLAVANSGDLLVTAGHDGTVKTWRMPRLEPAATMPSNSGRIVAVAMSPDGQTIASCGYDKTVRIWNVGSGLESGTLTGHAADGARILGDLAKLVKGL